MFTVCKFSIVNAILYQIFLLNHLFISFWKTKKIIIKTKIFLFNMKIFQIYITITNTFFKEKKKEEIQIANE